MNQYKAMSFAIRPSVIIRLLGDLYLLLAMLTAVPGIFAFISGSAAAGIGYGIVISIMLFTWGVSRLLPRPSSIQHNEVLSLVAVLFLSLSILMTLPLLALDMRFVDAWFETTSGVTTTGLSTLDLANTPLSLLFGRAWMQWLGGIGVVVLALAFMIRPGGAAISLGFKKSEIGDVVGGTRAHAKRVIVIYCSLTVIGIIALLLTGSSLLDSIVHTMAAVSTGGFSNYNDSLASNSWVHIHIVNLLCICGAISFHVYYFSLFALKRGKKLDNQLIVLMVFLTGAISSAWLICEITNFDIGIGHLITLLVSSQTTAGFATTDVALLPAWLLIFMIVLMAIGGGIGSTSGGIKLGRVVYFFNWSRQFLVQASMPDSTYRKRESSISKSESGYLEEAVALVLCFIFVLLVSWLIFVIHGYPPLESLFEVTSALATAGLSSGITGQDLPSTLKIVLCIDMLFGRVELLAFFILAMPSTWLGHRRKSLGEWYLRDRPRFPRNLVFCWEPSTLIATPRDK